MAAIYRGAGRAIPSVFIETNIRTVFIHYFFKRANKVRDREILPLIEGTLERKNPREWYSTLMDFGSYLKAGNPRIGERSAHYKKQPPFAGSRRQVRGLILKLLTQDKELTVTQLTRRLDREIGFIRKILAELRREGFLESRGGRYGIT